MKKTVYRALASRLFEEMVNRWRVDKLVRFSKNTYAAAEVIKKAAFNHQGNEYVLVLQKLFIASSTPSL
jgi:hypothetical protein